MTLLLFCLFYCKNLSPLENGLNYAFVKRLNKRFKKKSLRSVSPPETGKS